MLSFLLLYRYLILVKTEKTPKRLNPTAWWAKFSSHLSVNHSTEDLSDWQNAYWAWWFAVFIYSHYQHSLVHTMQNERKRWSISSMATFHITCTQTHARKFMELDSHSKSIRCNHIRIKRRLKMLNYRLEALPNIQDARAYSAGNVHGTSCDTNIKFLIKSHHHTFRCHCGDIMWFVLCADGSVHHAMRWWLQNCCAEKYAAQKNSELSLGIDKFGAFEHKSSRREAFASETDEATVEKTDCLYETRKMMNSNTLVRFCWSPKRTPRCSLHNWNKSFKLKINNKEQRTNYV